MNTLAGVAVIAGGVCVKSVFWIAVALQRCPGSACSGQLHSH